MDIYDTAGQEDFSAVCTTPICIFSFTLPLLLIHAIHPHMLFPLLPLFHMFIFVSTPSTCCHTYLKPSQPNINLLPNLLPNPPSAIQLSLSRHSCYLPIIPSYTYVITTTSSRFSSSGQSLILLLGQRSVHENR